MLPHSQRLYTYFTPVANFGNMNFRIRPKSWEILDPVSMHSVQKAISNRGFRKPEKVSLKRSCGRLVSTTASDTDFTSMLLDVRPDATRSSYVELPVLK